MKQHLKIGRKSAVLRFLKKVRSSEAADDALSLYSHVSYRIPKFSLK